MNNIYFKTCYHKLKDLLATEYNCNPDDFEKNENIVTISALNEGRRMYTKEKYFFSMVTFGSNTVITADEQLHPFLEEYIKDKQGHLLLELCNLLPIEKELNKYGYTFDRSHHMFLPYFDVTPKKDYKVKWFYDREIDTFYGDDRFPNAICEEYLPHRPDRIVVCAYDKNNEIMGMAGCSEDAKGWQQIGIDVMPKYRSMGVGTYLVTLLKNEIIKRGDIPFYGTSVANYHSRNIALNCGFKPMWVELGAKRIK